MNLLALVLLVLVNSVEAQPGGVAPQMLEETLRDGYVEYFLEDPSNEMAAQTARYLKETKAPIQIQRLRPSTLAQYTARDNRIIVNILPLAEKYSRGEVDEWNEQQLRDSIRESWRSSPETLRAFVRRTAVVIVHEAGHAIYEPKTNADFNSVEAEQAVRAREMVFLLATLRRDPSFMMLDKYDGLMRKVLSVPVRGSRNAALEPMARRGVIYPVARASDEPQDEKPRQTAKIWWRDPLPPGLTGEAVSDADSEVRQRFPGEFDRIHLTWYLVRLLTEGPKKFHDHLAKFLPRHYESLDQDWDKHLKEKHAELAKLKRQVRKAELAERVEMQSRIRGLREHIESDQAFYGNKEKVRAYRTYFEEETAKLDVMLENEGRGMENAVVPMATR